MDQRFALDGYVVDELIGFGGTGEVWRARESETGDTVALKRLRTRGAAATERLRREAALLATVAGPHVIGVRRLVVEGDEAVLVMDHAAGGSLATVLGVRGRLPAPEVVTALAPIAAALAAAHARDLIHGDITPANILFTADGRPLLADFGVAQALGTTSPVVEGTVDYFDPVVAGGGAPTAASDVFALGAVGFTALTASSLWGSGPAATMLARAAAGERPSLLSLAPDTPPALAAVVESMLSLDPDDRPSPRSVATAVLRACAAAPVGLVHTLPPRPLPMTDRVVRPEPADELLSADDDDSRLTTNWRRRAVIVAIAAVSLVSAGAIGVGLAHVGRGQASALVAAPVTTPPGSVRATTPAPQTSATTPGQPTSAASPAAAPAPTRTPTSWLTVVGSLDSLRAKAFATGDAAPLASVYTPGSPAYAADVATVSSLESRGLRARGFTATVQAVTVESATATIERLRVVDALTGYALVDAQGDIVGHGAARPARAFAMSLTTVAGNWRVASITPA